MNREERERLVDGVLDRALGPQAVEPRPGLEERILANLPAHAPRPWWQWMWIPALAAAAVLAIVIGMRLMQKETPQPVRAKKTVETPQQEVATRPEAPVVKKATPPRVIAKQASRRRMVAGPKVEFARATPSQELPRQAVFPALLPLTEQERLLLAFVNRQRPQAELVASEQQAEREKVQKYFETGEAPVAQPTPAQPMR
jgi:hypothetical protein